MPHDVNRWCSWHRSCDSDQLPHCGQVRIPRLLLGASHRCRVSSASRSVLWSRPEGARLLCPGFCPTVHFVRRWGCEVERGLGRFDMFFSGLRPVNEPIKSCVGGTFHLLGRGLTRWANSAESEGGPAVSHHPPHCPLVVQLFLCSNQWFVASSE